VPCSPSARLSESVLGSPGADPFLDLIVAVTKSTSLSLRTFIWLLASMLSSRRTAMRSSGATFSTLASSKTRVRIRIINRS
jgi:hypothetical protein